MSTIDLSSVQAALADFVDQRVLPGIADSNSLLKWAVGGTSVIVLSRLEKIVQDNLPMLKSLGIVNESGHFDMDVAARFLEGAFARQEEFKLSILGTPFIFDKTDGEALIKLLRQHGGLKDD